MLTPLPPARLLLPGTWLAVSLLVVACSADEATAPGAEGSSGGKSVGGAVGSGGSVSGGRAGTTGGSTTTGGTMAASGGGGGAPNTGGRSSSASGGSAPTGGSTPGNTGGVMQSPSGGSPGSGGGGTSTSSGGSETSASGGSMNTSGMTGSGGMSTGGAAGGGAGGTAGGGMTGSSEPDIPCPAGASFCSGFEGSALPAGTRFHAIGPTDVATYAFDTMNPKSGTQSLSIPEHTGGFYYRALAVPVPGNDFWVRLYVRVSRTFGDGGHDSLFGASDGGLEADVNGEALVEFSEQFEEVLLNTDDRLFNPEGMATMLPANMWHCIEAHYEGGSGNVQIFANGNEIINAPGYAKTSFETFRLGYMQYHDTRGVWYDDVIVAPTRVNCE